MFHKVKKICFCIVLLMFVSSLAFTQNFTLQSEKFVIGETYISNPKIIFALASYTLQEESYSHLDSIAEFLIEHDNLIVEVGTHTDCRISKASSKRLDQKRSEVIVEYLIKKGVNSNCLIAKGYGDSQLLISEDKTKKMKTNEDKEKAHVINRRTEFKIIAV